DGAFGAPRHRAGDPRHRAAENTRRPSMSGFGIVLLLMVIAGLVLTGLPAVAVLAGVAAFGAAVGVATGVFPVELLSALPARIINLLENDLLQALPLYVLMGLTLNRLPIAESL